MLHNKKNCLQNFQAFWCCWIFKFKLINGPLYTLRLILNSKLNFSLFYYYYHYYVLCILYSILSSSFSLSFHVYLTIGNDDGALSNLITLWWIVNVCDLISIFITAALMLVCVYVCVYLHVNNCLRFLLTFCFLNNFFLHIVFQ